MLYCKVVSVSCLNTAKTIVTIYRKWMTQILIPVLWSYKVNDTNTHTSTVILQSEWHKYSYQYCDPTKWMTQILIPVLWSHKVNDTNTHTGTVILLSPLPVCTSPNVKLSARNRKQFVFRSNILNAYDTMKRRTQWIYPV